MGGTSSSSASRNAHTLNHNLHNSMAAHMAAKRAASGDAAPVHLHAGTNLPPPAYVAPPAYVTPSAPPQAQVVGAAGPQHQPQHQQQLMGPPGATTVMYTGPQHGYPAQPQAQPSHPQQQQPPPLMTYVQHASAPPVGYAVPVSVVPVGATTTTTGYYYAPATQPVQQHPQPVPSAPVLPPPAYHDVVHNDRHTPATTNSMAATVEPGDAASIGATQEDVRTFASVWFRRNAFFKNRSHLLDEMSFVAHYHFGAANRTCHLVGWTLIEAALLTALQLLVPAPSVSVSVGGGSESASVSVVAGVCALLYASFHATLNPWVGALGLLRYAALLYGGAQWITAFHCTAAHVPYALAVALAGLVVQGLGHAIDGRVPAFRAFEAAVTTPFFLWLNVLFVVCGYQPRLRARIDQLSHRWAHENRRDT